MITSYLALFLRIVLLGYERILVKQLGSSKHGKSASFILFFIAVFFYIPFLFNRNIPSNINFYLYLIVPAIIYTCSFYIYVLSLRDGEISLVGPLYNFNVFFLLLISFVFLSEKITIFKVGGILLMIFGASKLNNSGNILRSLTFLFKDRACLYMVIFSFLLAIGRTIDKALSIDADPVIYGFILYLYMSILLFIVNTIKGEGFSSFLLIKEMPFKSLMAGAVNTFSYVFLLVAMKHIDVSVVEPCNMLSMIISLIMASIVFKEKVRDRIPAVLIMLAGAYLLLV